MRILPVPLPGLVLSLILAACGRSVSRPVSLPAEFQTALAGSVLYVGDRQAAAGILDLSAQGAIDILLVPPLPVPPLASLELEYSLRDSASAADGPVLSYGDSGKTTGSFVLPLVDWDPAGGRPAEGDPADGGPEFSGGPTLIRYAVPLLGDSLDSLRIDVAAAEGEGRTPGSPILELRSLDIVGRWYGVERDSRGLRISPFVFTDPQGSIGIETPKDFAFPGGTDLLIRAGGSVRWAVGDRRFEKLSGEEGFIPAGFFPVPATRVLAEGEDIESIRLVPAQPRSFPQPLPLDPALILNYPPSSWRRGDYEVFRWDVFPSLLIFDTADYAVQDRLLKRLAFFVEKAGYQGRLMEDGEIADQHGWNAHDYRALDLARFFEAVRLAEFPLLREERELEALLFDSGIILRDGDRIVPGEGGIISISRESPSYLRSLFMAHEGFHGIFFVDEEFREFSRRRWENFPPVARRFILSYFDYQHYDTTNEYLVINEFMAHVLQQPVSRAGSYFGETLASRIDASPWRRTVLPEKDEQNGNWPVLSEDFLAEAIAFDAYAARRWGLGAGRVHRISVRD